MSRLLVCAPLFASAVLAHAAPPSFQAAAAPTSQSPSPTAQSPQNTPPPAAAADLPDGPGLGAQVHAPITPTGPTALIDTSMGRLSCKLYDKQAPVTVANFIGLSNGSKDWVDPQTLKKVHGQSFYAGTTFHRVIPGFMIQGGDRVGDGTGDPGYLFADEIDPALTFDVPGRLAMANSGPSTNGSQFFITEVPVPELTGRHTIFGQCDSDTINRVAAIARVDRSATDKPTTPVVIRRITIVPAGQPIPPDPAAGTTTPAAAPSAVSPAPAPH